LGPLGLHCAGTRIQADLKCRFLDEDLRLEIMGNVGVKVPRDA
jgi:hypothetical protein